MMKEKKLKIKRLSVDIPEKLMLKISENCTENYISKRKWVIDAIINKLRQDESKTVDKFVI